METKNFESRVTAASTTADTLIKDAEVLLELKEITPNDLKNHRQKLVDHMRLMEAFQAEVNDLRKDDGDEDPQKKKATDEMVEQLDQKRNDENVKALHNMINALQEKIDKMKEVTEERPQAPEPKGGSERPDQEIPNVVRQKTKPRSNSYCQGDARDCSSTPVVQMEDESAHRWNPENGSASNLGEAQGKQTVMDFKTIHNMLQQFMDSMKQDMRMMAEAIIHKEENRNGQQNYCEAPALQKLPQNQCIGFNPRTGRPDPLPSNDSIQQGRSMVPLEASANPAELGEIMTEQLKSSLVSSLMVAVKPFDGEEHKYLEFMAQFDAIVHSNKFLSDAMKQSILFTLLTPKLSLEHSPTEYSTAGYYRLRDSLHRQFGRVNTQLAIIMELMDDLDFPSNDNKALSAALHTYATYANKLRPFGTNPDDPFFIKSFIQKLPEKLARALNKKRARAGADVTLESLMDEAHNYVEFEKIFKKPTQVKEKYNAEVNLVKNQDQTGGFRPKFSSKNEKGAKKYTGPPSKETPCKFCYEVNHSANTCNASMEKKFNAVYKTPLCYNCLSEKHAASDCKSKYRCFYCQGKHYTGICIKYPRGQHDGRVMEYLNQDDEDDESSEA